MLNSAQIIGRVGRDPELRYMPSGEAVANLTIATSESWKDKQTGEKKEATEWHKVTFFGRLAEIAGEYLKKGALVYVQGKIITRKYTDKDGSEKYSTEIRAAEMKMLSSKDGQNSAPPAQRQAAPQRQQAPAAAPSGFDDMDDDIPF
jgi:single-strand DNA-binding protein